MSKFNLSLTTKVAELAAIPSKLKTRSKVFDEIWGGFYEFAGSPWVSYKDPQAEANLADLILMFNFIDAGSGYRYRRWRDAMFERFREEVKSYGWILEPPELENLVRLYASVRQLPWLRKDDACELIRLVSAEHATRRPSYLMTKPSFVPLLQHATAIATFAFDYEAVVRDIAAAARKILTIIQEDINFRAKYGK